MRPLAALPSVGRRLTHTRFERCKCTDERRLTATYGKIIEYFTALLGCQSVAPLKPVVYMQGEP